MSKPLPLRLAANGFQDLYALLDAGENLPLDFIKCPLSADGRAEVAQALKYRPVLLHGWGPGGYSITQAEIPEPELLRELAPLSGSPNVSVHLHYKPERDGELGESALLERIQANVQRLQDLSGLPILLENVPFYPWVNVPRRSSDPDLIERACAASGAGFLLDLAHARVGAYHRQQDIHEYLSAMPLELVQEIHTSGPRLEEKGLMDRHLTLQPEDWELLRWTLERTPNVRILTHEYMGLRPNTQNYPEAHDPATLHGEILKMHALAKELTA